MDGLMLIIALFLGVEVSVNIARLIYSIYRDRRSEKVLREELKKRLQVDKENDVKFQCHFCQTDEEKKPKTESYIS